MTDSTIAALATSPAPAGIAVVRVSGTDTRKALHALFKSSRSPVEHPREMIYGKLIDHKSGATIDHALAVYMPGPKSFTGEDVAEFQFHGSPLIAQKLLRSLFAFGISPAEPGEFTRRAFLNGKLDLVQAEAIADLINATSDRALRLASEQLSGRLSTALDTIGEPLRDTLSELEASIDFPEEEINPRTLESISASIRLTQDNLNAILETYSYGHTVKEGLRVLLCGEPNAGKSSLLNRLAGRKRAIVTDVSGTTRDTIEEEVSFKGYKFLLCDSAGLRESNDEVEKIGIELARERLPWADLVFFVLDAETPGDTWLSTLATLREQSKEIWMIINKIDTAPGAIGTLYCDSSICTRNFYVSANTGDGIDSLTEALVERVVQGSGDAAEASQVITNERHRTALHRAISALTAALEAIENSLPLEIVSGELRVALSALDEVIGRTHTEDILGRIFGKFCIGK